MVGKRVVFMCLVAIFSIYLVQFCKVSAQESIRLVIVDHSKAAYGIQLKSEVCTQLEKQLSIRSTQKNELREVIKGLDLEEISKAEKHELALMTEKMGVNKIIIVEILPAMIEYNQIVFCQTIKADATLRIRLYDADKGQYVLREDSSGKGSNKTFIPYTSIGTKPAVQEAVHNATLVAANQINKILRNGYIESN